MITVDNRFGVVAKLTARYVVVRSLDGVEAVVPNETLVTTTVLNHSYTSREIRVAIPVQVSYDSDVERALALMEEAARGEPRCSKRRTSRRDACPIQRKRHRSRAGRVDQRSGERAGKSERARSISRSCGFSGRNDIRIPYPQRDLNIIGGSCAHRAGSPA
jgi:small-conductance mechanosensitive channel